MKTKQIRLSDGTVKEMTYEEVRIQFMDMLKKEIRNATMNFTHLPIELENEDFSQNLEIEMWRAYEKYDVERGTCFSTLLTMHLMKGVRDTTYCPLYSEKHKSPGLIPLETPVDEIGRTVLDVVSDPCDEILAFDNNDLISKVAKTLTEDERMTLRCILDKKNFSVQIYADTAGITRAGANQRVLKLTKKLQVLLADLRR